MLDEFRSHEVIELCREMIRIKSYSGKEKEIVEKLKKVFLSMGFDDYYIDKYGSIIAHIKGDKSGKTILFDGHIDTVIAEDEVLWTHKPFDADVVDGKIFGRGASDMKGALSAMICAASYFAKDNRNFSGNIYVACTVQEECFEGVAAREISKQIKPDYVIIGEATELNLNVGQRGRAEIVVETHGKSVHTSNPQDGINAVYMMTTLIERIKKIKPKSDNFLGNGILELTDIISLPYPGASVVPYYCKATFDRRLLIDESKEDVLKPLIEVILQIKAENSSFDANVFYSKGKEKCYTGCEIESERYFPAWLMDENDEFIQRIYQGLIDTGLHPTISHYNFCTNGSHYAGEAGIKTVGFGPSKENLAHTIDEYVEIEQLLKAVEGYYTIAKSLLS